MKSLIRAATVLVAALALTGCTADSAPDPAETATTPPTAEPTVITLEDLQNKYVDVGGQCDSISVRTTSVAEEAGDCDGGALLTTYSSVSQRDGAINVLEGLQDSNPSPHVIAVGPDWIVNGADAGSFADAMGGEPRQIGDPAAPTVSPTPDFDLTTDDGLCAADAELTNLELNDAIAPLLGYAADRDARTFEQDEAIRDYKNAAFLRACPARAS